MKKLMFLVSLMTVTMFSVGAAEIRHPGIISLQQKKVISIPPIRPFSEPETMFSLYATTDALELTSESAQGNAWITVTGPTGVVYSSLESMNIGSELTIPVEDFPAGAYTISILYNATIYVGEFEVE